MPTITSEAVSRDESSIKAFPMGALYVRTGEVEVTKAQMEDADSLFQMVPVYKGETVYHIILQCDDMSTGSDIVLDVGDGLVTDRYIDGSTIGQTGGTVSMGEAAGVAPSATEFPFTYTADDTIDVDIAVAATTGTTGPATLRVIAFIG